MIVYYDTFALVKLYVAEDGSREMKALLSEAEVPATARISWVEAHAVMACWGRERVADAAAIDQARAALRTDWPHFLVLDLTQELCERAAAHAEVFALRAYDGVQLASADWLQKCTGPDVVFACFDRRLNQAARVLGLRPPSD
ncbi:MAG: type II toxin-antitoxin system VapC family toxin [Porticoccaceae bacterium]